MSETSGLNWLRGVARTWRLWFLTVIVAGLTYYGYVTSGLMDAVLLALFSVLIALFALTISESNRPSGS